MTCSLVEETLDCTRVVLSIVIRVNRYLRQPVLVSHVAW